MRAESIAVVPPPVAVPAESGRQLPFDWLRGLVMVLMSIDHASGEFNAGRLFTDATFMYQPGTHLDTAQFLTRWITHLCAPTFVFLAGYVLQLSVRRRTEKREGERSITRFIITRGLIIAALDPLWMVLVFRPPGGLIVHHPNFANPFGGQNGWGHNDPSVPGVFGCSCATPDVAASNPVIGSGGSRAVQLGLKFTF